MPPSVSTLSKHQILYFLKQLREEIITNFTSIETSGAFHRTKWDHHSGGGGEISLLRGEVFEKAAVNWSAVWGDKFPGSDEPLPFFATGVSLITHMRNPHAPTSHMNVRYIECGDSWWLGGGYDLTPMGFPYEEDTQHFHQTAKSTLDAIDPLLYPSFSQQAKEYFFIPHRKKERGIGGIFFDHYHTNNEEKDFQMWEEVGKSFIQAVMPIYRRRVHTPYTAADKELQLKLRAHYVEFNLLYDRGTKFGFLSGGNPEAILCSMPPEVKW